MYQGKNGHVIESEFDSIGPHHHPPVVSCDLPDGIQLVYERSIRGGYRIT
jgi:hypothetical protein